MKKQTSLWLPLTKVLNVGVLLLSVLTSLAMGQVGHDLQHGEFSDDPSMTEIPVDQSTPPTSSLTIKSSDGQTNLGVETSTPLSPYLGVVKKQPDVPDDMSDYLRSRSDNPLDNYHLETGVGVSVNKQTELNLGYRLNNSPSLLDDQNNKALNGDLRFSLEIKLPF